MKTRKELEDVIRGGGSVIVDGRHVARIEELPGEAVAAAAPEVDATAVAASTPEAEPEAEAEAEEFEEAVTTSLDEEPKVVRKGRRK